MKNKQAEIVLGVTGSIAAYKAAELTRLMVKAGWGVSVVMTASAAKFVTPLTFQTLSQRRVITSVFEPVEIWMPGHISLADLADVLVIAPCTANMMAKLAGGLSDDALSSTALACRAQLVIAPAMNDGMWEHAATRENERILRERGAHFVEVGSGDLACGRIGRGRMAEVADVFAAVKALVK